MAELFALALILCTTGEADCAYQYAGQYTIVTVCDLTPGNTGHEDVMLEFDGKTYIVTLKGECTDA